MVIFLSAFLGSLGLDLFVVISAYETKGSLPARYREKTYWVALLTFKIIAGLLPVLFGIKDPIHAFDIGVCAPLLFHAALSRLRHV
jgi:hypothetical protein